MVNLEPCNRCCSDGTLAVLDEKEQIVTCSYCGFQELFNIWQLRGWRLISKYPPVYSGVMFVYGKEIGRTIAKWDVKTKTCDNPQATHWLRTPDPRKQVNMFN